MCFLFQSFFLLETRYYLNFNLIAREKSSGNKIKKGEKKKDLILSENRKGIKYNMTKVGIFFNDLDTVHNRVCD